MGYIKEPKGIDLVVVPQSKPNIEANNAVSDFIAHDKLRRQTAQAKKNKSKQLG